MFYILFVFVNVTATSGNYPHELPLSRRDAVPSCTECAADSTKSVAWDRNLMTEWHARYGGRGVMIYWHVERRATCVYSQLKRCSSSEVASMIEGVLRH